jgi:hypothetical protein
VVFLLTKLLSSFLIDAMGQYRTVLTVSIIALPHTGRAED